jgi:hypothetical protein
MVLNCDTHISGTGILAFNGGIRGEHALSIQSIVKATCILVDALNVQGTLTASSIQVDTPTIKSAGAVQAVPETNTFFAAH